MAMSRKDSVSGYRLDDITLDVERRLVTRGRDTIQLGKLTYELLVTLAASAPRVVTRAELVERLWGGRYVSPETVKQRVKLLRQALSDDADHPRYIRVVRGQGYRLIPDVEPLTADTSQSKWKRPILLASVAVLAGIAVLSGVYWSSPDVAEVDVVLPNSIAVLPFENRSALEEDEYFVGGIHDELLTRLAMISSLKVISRTSVMQYADTQKTMRQIGDELGVATILEGGVQRAGEDIRINVQLIDAESDEQLWGEIYNRELTAANVFAIQSEMAFSIAEELQAMLLPDEVARLNAVPTSNTRAWNFYLSGNDYYNRPDDRNNQPFAVQQYERAVAEDPNFALAWAALSGAHSSMYFYGVDPSESRLELARNAVERALELNPNLPEAHLAYAEYHQRTRNIGAALEQLAIAEQGLSGTPDIFQQQALIQRRLGDIDGSVANIERAIGLDPRNTDRLFQQVVNFMGTGRYFEARGYLDRMLEIAPDNQFAHGLQRQIPLLENGEVTAYRTRGQAGRHYDGYVAALYDRDYEAALLHLDFLRVEFATAANSFSPITSYRGLIHRLGGSSESAVEAFTAARAQIETALENSPRDARIVLALGEALVGIGEVEEGVRTAYRAMEILPASRDAVTGGHIVMEAVLRVFAPAGDYDAVIQHLDAYLSGPFAFWSIEGLLPDPRLDGIRDDPRFQALVEKYRRQ